MSTKSQIDLSVVLPVYKCGAALSELHQRLTRILATMSVSYEIILVDDGCPDNGWRGIVDLARQDTHVAGIRLSRNFGQAIAIAAGLAESRGEKVIVMDADLQDPPEAIPILWDKAQTGAALVYGRRDEEHQSMMRMAAGKLYFAFLRMISGRAIDPRYGTFTLLSRPTVDAYLRFTEPNRHYLFILYWLGFDGVDADYKRHKREIGQSSYRFGSLLRHSFQGVLFYSQSLRRLLAACAIGMGVTALLLFGGAGSRRRGLVLETAGGTLWLAVGGGSFSYGCARRPSIRTDQATAALCCHEKDNSRWL
ncbi:glycosyl transferase family 2 [Parvibaculum lavamentivorans DS-1]|uniref:Glycosyl transferase family 2 n=1 Tax=Parvibaculum lavamentivorans (strain DS-1 / DSM 13023 / NCIMB 13966) TaxID=402881 RepID=A7HYE0_PARL1|nr:glycosyltransferase family 2 protein [Parvibaculum lavamentivorans]ABS64923.1 glycosyl transferase family 2 [Parvibaculum lavamentivorans DS-1]